tara:strand:+ start:671 stop:904 length:234 start_codon:yes stop_codon:yes gene_type:complete
VTKTGVDVNDIGDVVVGSVLGNSSQRANECRIGMFLAGFPKEVPVRTVNRQCSSGLQARFILHWFPYDRVGVVNADP